MKDIERIDVTMDLISRYWKKNPELRLGQLISNFNTMSRNHRRYVGNYDIHSLEDEDLIKILKIELNDL